MDLTLGTSGIRAKKQPLGYADVFLYISRKKNVIDDPCERCKLLFFLISACEPSLSTVQVLWLYPSPKPTKKCEMCSKLKIKIPERRQ